MKKNKFPYKKSVKLRHKHWQSVGLSKKCPNGITIIGLLMSASVALVTIELLQSFVVPESYYAYLTQFLPKRKPFLKAGIAESPVTVQRLNNCLSVG